MFAPRDLTEGTPWQRILLFTIPMLVGNIAQQLYNTADSIIVGKYVGDNALAAVGSASPVLHLVMVLFMGVAVGAGIMVSQYYGAKDREMLSKTIGICLTLTAIASVIIMVLGPLITRPLLNLLNTPPAIIDWCADYLQIFFLGALGMAYYNILSGILRGLGDSLSALVYLLLAAGLNVVLDIIFVAKFNMGVPGVALATVISQAVSAVLCAFKLVNMKESFEITWQRLKLEKQHVTDLLRLGLPSGLTQAVFSMAMIAVQSLTNSFGEMFIAANVIVMRVDGFAMMPNFSFSNAMTTFTGQNVGANKPERVETGIKQGLTMAVGTSAALTLLILIFGKTLIGFFTTTESLVNYSMGMLRILAAGYVAMAITQSLSGVMRGAGDTTTPMWISLINTIGMRVPLAYLFVNLTKSVAAPQGRPESLYVSLLISWIMGAVLTTFFFRRGAWREKSLVKSKLVSATTD